MVNKANEPNKTVRSEEISDFIQQQLRARNKKIIDPVTASSWLIEEGLQKEIGTRPGSFLRSLCRKGLIDGAEKKGSNWGIKRIKKKR